MDHSSSTLESGLNHEARPSSVTRGWNGANLLDRLREQYWVWQISREPLTRGFSVMQYESEIPLLDASTELHMTKKRGVAAMSAVGMPSETVRAQIILVPYNREHLRYDIKPRFSYHLLKAVQVSLEMDQAMGDTLVILARHSQSTKSIIELPSKVHRNPSTSNLKIKRHLVLAEAAIYQNDASIYILNPHCNKPLLTSLDIAYVEPNTDRGPWSAMVTCSNVELLGRFDESLSRVQEAVEQNAIVRFPRYALCQVDKFCVEHYCQVLRSLDESISRLRWEGRRSPSIGKVDYLLHVEDCLSCMQAFSVPDPWQGTDWPSDELTAWHRNLMEDQQYIVKQAARLREVSVTTRKAIQERLVTYSNYRITRVSVLAAVYIPLTFATGLFGMNIAEINGSIPEYWHVLAIGIPLTLLTVVGPLTIGPLTQFWLAGIKKERLPQFLWSAWFVASTISVANKYVYGKNSNRYLGVVEGFFMTLILTASNIVTEGLLDVLIRLAFILLQASCLISVVVASSLSPNLAEWVLVLSTALWLVLMLYRGIVWLHANWQVKKKKLKQQ